jgi:hypothetical protein
MIIDATDAQAEAVLRALYTVASANGTEPISTADGWGIQGAQRTLLGRSGTVDLDALPVISPAELATSVTDAGARLEVLRAQAVMVLVDAIIDDAKFAVVIETAKAFDQSPGFVEAYTRLMHNDVRAAAAEMVRENSRSGCRRFGRQRSLCAAQRRACRPGNRSFGCDGGVRRRCR